MPAAYMVANITIGGSMIRPEAFGRTVIEAQGMGCPVIANNTGAPSETVLDYSKYGPEQYTGWLVPPEHPDALADILEKALTLSEDELKNLGKRAQSHITKHFYANKMRQETLAVYDELLNTHLSTAFIKASK
jgi:glycosyltransferase involved in cell wall biosynthesis